MGSGPGVERRTGMREEFTERRYQTHVQCWRIMVPPASSRDLSAWISQHRWREIMTTSAPASAAASTDIGLFEAMYTARSLRHFKPDPVPQALITRVLDAAIRASSGGNTQHWNFVVV